jgi:transposase, IS30 family
MKMRSGRGCGPVMQPSPPPGRWGGRPRPALRAIVGEQLKLKWSPQQIAGWLKATYPNDAEMQVSHETIYRTVHPVPRQ